MLTPVAWGTAHEYIEQIHKLLWGKMMLEGWRPNNQVALLNEQHPPHHCKQLCLPPRCTRNLANRAAADVALNPTFITGRNKHYHPEVPTPRPISPSFYFDISAGVQDIKRTHQCKTLRRLISTLQQRITCVRRPLSMLRSRISTITYP